MTDFALRRTMMVDTQIRPSDVTKYPIIDAMLHVPREEFVPSGRREAAYMGENIDLDGGRVILDPRTLAKMLEVLDVASGDLVLDIGPSYGYSSAVLARLAQAVVAVEDNADFRREAQEALMGADADNVILHEAPLAEGAAEHGPYNVILVQGGVMHIPQTILDQLKEGGRIAALFMDGPLGEVRVGYKIDGHVTWRRAFNAGATVLSGFERQPQFTL